MRTNANEARPEVRRESDPLVRRVREPAAVEDVQQFRQLFEHQRAVQETIDDPTAMPLRAKAIGESRNDLVSAEMLALLQTHRLAFEPSAPAAPPVPTASPGLADLIERHVRQLLVSESRSAVNGDTRVMLRLSDSLLPGTDLTLTRGESGWVLRAEVTDAQSRAALERCSSELVARFEKGGLGAITVETDGTRG
jgi:hypothetical protein